jgi:hypothetical protein
MLRWPARVLRWLLVPRSTLPMLASVAYVGLTSLRAAGMDDRFAWVAAVVAFFLILQRIRREKARLAITGAAREVTPPDQLFAVWALAIGIASLGAPPARSTWNDLFGALAMGASSILAIRPLDELREPGGMLATQPSRSRFFPGLLAFAWLLVLGDELRAGLLRSSFLAREASDLGGIFAVMSALAVLALALYHAKSRVLELDVASRATSLAGRAAITIGTGFAIAIAADVPVARLGRVALPALALLAIGAVHHGDPVADARRIRRALALAIVGGPLLLLGVTSAHGRDAALATAVTGAVLLAVGALGRFLEEPLRPAQGVLLDAIAAAERVLAGAEPETAAREVLTALRATLPPDGPSPQLWTLDPPRALEVDAAGYGHVRKAVLPPDLLSVASEEPHATIRTNVLEALAVRRADLRALGTWMDRDDALTATVVTKNGEVEGVLILPRETARAPITLEEVVALKRLADGIAGALAEESRVARARDREAAIRAELSKAEAALAVHERADTVRRETNRLATSRLARPATVGIYSRIASHAHRELEDAAARDRPVCILAATGVDPIPFVARSHLGGLRGDRPLVIVEGTSTREHDPKRWRDLELSPLALANGGVLFLLDGACLPIDVQIIIATALVERRMPWNAANKGDGRDAPEPFEAVAILSSSRAPKVLMASGDLAPALAARFGAAVDTPVVLPRLADRPEDLRAVVADRLAREGLRAGGKPVGIDDGAFAILIEHPFSGDDAELSWLVQRLVQNVQMVGADVVRGAHVRAVLTTPLGEEPIPADSGDSAAPTESLSATKVR